MSFWRRITGRVCTQCKGRGWNLVGDEERPCSGCIGTGVKLAQDSEIWTEKRGVIREERRKK